MPHIVVEYVESALGEQELKTVLRHIHDAVSSSGLFEVSHIRTRAYPFSEFTNGIEGGPYIHVQARIKSGRDADNKKRLAETILVSVSALSLPVSVITVEIVDMDRDSYSKWNRT
ncbi:MAG: hypothetical protein OEZ47_08840 [Gammaproteobacteria bacterium]|nr:hypothetical protein [Gammaproteobacteria bacterium]